MAAFRRNKAVEWFWWLHPRVYRWTGGRVGGRVFGMPVLLLTTRGRRTGRPHRRALTYLEDGNRYVVLASNLGSSHHPAWWLNLRDHPRAEVQIGRRAFSVTAREVEGEERSRLWEAAVTRYPDYEEYQRRTKRRIPVVVLEPDMRG